MIQISGPMDAMSSASNQHILEIPPIFSIFGANSVISDICPYKNYNQSTLFRILQYFQQKISKNTDKSVATVGDTECPSFINNVKFFVREACISCIYVYLVNEMNFIATKFTTEFVYLSWILH